MKRVYKYFVWFALTLPLFAHAQLPKTDLILRDALRLVTEVLVPLAFILAVLFFFWGIAKYIRSAGGEKEEGKKIMIWGVVALFVMASVWGLVAFLKQEFMISDVPSMPVPTITTGGA